MVIDSTFIPSPLPGNQGKCQSVTIGLVLLAISILMCFQKSPHSHITPRSLSTLRKFQGIGELCMSQEPQKKTKYIWGKYFVHPDNKMYIFIVYHNSVPYLNPDAWGKVPNKFGGQVIFPCWVDLDDSVLKLRPTWGNCKHYRFPGPTPWRL